MSKKYVGRIVMTKIPKKAKVTYEHSIPMSDGHERILRGEIVDVYLAPSGENIWTCRFQGKEFTINKTFLEVVEYEEFK